AKLPPRVTQVRSLPSAETYCGSCSWKTDFVDRRSESSVIAGFLCGRDTADRPSGVCARLVSRMAKIDFPGHDAARQFHWVKLPTVAVRGRNARPYGRGR